jgi:hypothetical protein
MVRAFDQLLEPDERFRLFIRFENLQSLISRDNYDRMA